MTLVEVRPPVLTAPGAPITAQQIAAQCRSLVVWAEHCDSISELKEAAHKLNAIERYLEDTSSEGRNAVASARLRLEARIGELLGPTTPGRRHDREEPSPASEGSSELSPNQRSQFRKLADHPDIVEEVIDTSDDADPASRRKALDEINRRRHTPPPPPTEEELREQELADSDRRAATRLIKGLDGWDQLTTFRSYPRRAQVLALLTEGQRNRLAAIEGELHG